MKNFIYSLAAFTARALPSPLRKQFYNLGPLTAMIRKVLNRSAPDSPIKVKIAAGTLKGYSFILNIKNEKDYWLGTYETDLLDAIQMLVKPGMVAYDVGANVGYITLVLQRAVGPGGKVFAFEALPENIKRLEANTKINPNLRVSTDVIHAAIAHQTQQVQFLVHASDDMGKIAGAAGRTQTSYEGEITVPGFSLDDFVYHYNHAPPDVIKMDIEGGEIFALPGAKKILTELSPMLFLELHGEKAAQTAWHILTENGYQIYSLVPGFPQIKALEDLNWKAYILACKPELE